MTIPDPHHRDMLRAEYMAAHDARKSAERDVLSIAIVISEGAVEGHSPSSRISDDFRDAMARLAAARQAVDSAFTALCIRNAEVAA